MKTPRFWYPQRGKSPASLLSHLLLPLTVFFKAGAAVRRFFAVPYRPAVPLICVGNVVAGGAGKTPTTLALAQLLKDHGRQPVFVTRGYGGHGQLTHVNPAEHEVEDVGDEALLLAAQAPTWACNDRVEALREAQKHGSVILMDDGLQNPHFTPTKSILVIDGDVGIGNGRLIPAGPLRENLLQAVKRVAVVIIIGERDRQNLAARIQSMVKNNPVAVFRARLQPKLPLGFPRDSAFVAFAGIARPEKFYATARGLGLTLAATQDFADHHVYSDAEIDALRLMAELKGARLLTTEKDAVRLPQDLRDEVVVLPVRLVFDDIEAEARLTKILA